MRRGSRVTDEELDAIGAEPAAGEVWWCSGPALDLNDGGKTRPVLVTGFFSDQANVIPLTTQKPAEGGIPVRHRSGLSWQTELRKTVPRIALLSRLS